MSPTLSRENYFLTVINRIEEHRVDAGSLEQELQQLLLDLAHMVLEKRSFTEAMIQRINFLFEQYQAIHLKLRIVPSTGDGAEHAPNERHVTGERQSILLYTDFTDGPDHLKRMYMEAIISLLETMERKPLDLQTCRQCGSWFIPYERAQVTWFCSTKCRNRYHYLLAKKKREDDHDHLEVR
ncbi:recombination protein NinG [Gorillibacterium timonense]|uniref:hypothetical protein n=1 Tax=Gorillibacterium timonense TaxID=1689269 RepID=UPI00071E652A|nr:hypothetical protein [Gorillibacterium timonense]